MTDDSPSTAKLDALGAQVGAVLIQLASLTANVEAARADISRTATETAHDLADHEVRIREIERSGVSEHGRALVDLGTALAELRTWRARTAGYVAGAAAAAGVGGAGLASLLNLGH